MANITIEIPCKTYVKAYLENNCGDPVDLKLLPDLHALFIRNLRYNKHEARREQKHAIDSMCNYKSAVLIKVPENIFYRYGWELSKGGLLEFNKEAETKIKFMMRYYVAFNRSLGIPVSTCIRDFQEKYDFPEAVWPYESIKKDFDRHGQFIRPDIMSQMKDEINKIFLSNLSTLGTVSIKLYKELSDEHR